MRKFFLLSASALLLLTAPPTPGYAASECNEVLLKQIAKGFSNVAKHATPAVVYIESQLEEKQPANLREKNPFDYFNDDFFNRFFNFPYEKQRPSKKETVRGSGFLVTEDGYIVTNNHVVENASKVTVTLNGGKKVTAKVVGCDPKTDLAVIKIEGKGYPFLTFGNSDTLEVGEWAIAIGNPFGLQETVTVGIVSAKGRNDLNIAAIEDFIQTDAAINPGNSGGPLLNVECEVIGVNTAIVSGSGGYMGIGFAIPSSMAKQIMAQLIKEGQVTRGFLGVTLQALDSELAGFYQLDHAKGALVSEVVKGSPAEQGGLKQEDIILSYNDQPVESLSTFRNAVSMMAPGSILKLKVLRDGKEKALTIKIASSPQEGGEMSSLAPLQKLGIGVQDVTPELAQKLGISSDTKGVVITKVTPNSAAAEGGLRPGGLIVAVNRQKVENLAEFTTQINKAAKEERVLLMVRQGDVIRFVALPLEN